MRRRALERPGIPLTDAEALELIKRVRALGLNVGVYADAESWSCRVIRTNPKDAYCRVQIGIGEGFTFADAVGRAVRMAVPGRELRFILFGAAGMDWTAGEEAT